MTDEAFASVGGEGAPEAVQTNETPPFEPTPRGSVDRAFKALEKAELEAQPGPEQGEPAKAKEAEQEGEGQPRGPDGKFTSKEGDMTESKPVEGETQQSVAKKAAGVFAEPPSRFSADAKAAWKNAPEAVRAEIHRAVAEMEKGIEQYRGQADHFAELEELDQLTRGNGTSIKAALTNYMNFEQVLRSDPERGLKQLFDNLRIDPRQYAERVLNVPEGETPKEDPTVRALQDQIAGLKQELSGVTTTVRSQQEHATINTVDQFARDNPRFDELSGEIAQMLETGYAKDLADAYRKAERLNPAPAPAAVTEPAKVHTPDPTAQTQKGQKSLSGAPATGSNPSTRKPASTARESVNRAFEQLGI